jgi:hypothetical protein
MPSKRGPLICPKCGKVGFITKRGVRSSYYPQKASVKCYRLEEEEEKLAKDRNDKSARAYVKYFRKWVRGNRYRGDREHEVIDKQSVYRVSSDKYYHYYIGHYDPDKYREQMIKYRNGERKSRSNGRRWCKLRLSSYRTEYHEGKNYIRIIYKRK